MGSVVSILSSSQRVPTALIVDTDLSASESLGRLLAARQVRALRVTDSIAAFALLRTEAIDILICEDLGGFHGIEVLEACEALFPKVRRVYLARQPSPELDGAATLRGHVHAIVTNAMSPVEVLDTIASLTHP